VSEAVGRRERGLAVRLVVCHKRRALWNATVVGVVLIRYLWTLRLDVRNR
jgi:hypothetical protein